MSFAHQQLHISQHITTHYYIYACHSHTHHTNPYYYIYHYVYTSARHLYIHSSLDITTHTTCSNIYITLSTTLLWTEKMQPFFSSSQKDYNGFIKYMKWLVQGNGKRLERLLKIDDENLLFILQFDLLEFIDYLSNVHDFIIAKMERVQKIQKQNKQVTKHISENPKLPNSIDAILTNYEYNKEDFEFQDKSLLNGFRYTGTIVENDGQNPYRMIGDVSDHYGVISYIYLNESDKNLSEVKSMYNVILGHGNLLDNAYRNIIVSSTNIPTLELFHRMNGSVFLQKSDDQSNEFLQRWLAVWRLHTASEMIMYRLPIYPV